MKALVAGTGAGTVAAAAARGGACGVVGAKCDVLEGLNVELCGNNGEGLDLGDEVAAVYLREADQWEHFAEELLELRRRVCLLGRSHLAELPPAPLKNRLKERDLINHELTVEEVDDEIFIQGVELVCFDEVASEDVCAFPAHVLQVVGAVLAGKLKDGEDSVVGDQGLEGVLAHGEQRSDEVLVCEGHDLETLKHICARHGLEVEELKDLEHHTRVNVIQGRGSL